MSLDWWRWKIGKWILRVYFYSLQNQTAAKMYRSGWRFINHFSFLFQESQLGENPLQMRKQEQLFGRVLKCYKRYYPSFVAPIAMVGEADVLQELRECNGGLIITIHTGLTAIHERLFEDIGGHLKTITISPGHFAVWGKILGMKGVPQTIAKNEYALLKARRCCANGHFVVNGVDYPWGADAMGKSNLFVSPSFFKFAKLIQQPVYYSVAFVDDNGGLNVAFARAPLVNIDDMFEDFTKFIKRYTGVEKRWSLQVEPKA